MKKYTIIHASRSRPSMAYTTFLNWMNNAIRPEEIEYIISIDNDDPFLNEYRNLFSGAVIIYNHGFRKTAVKAINKAAKFSSGNIIVVVSDDFVSYPGWDTDIILVTGGKSKFLLKTFDGIQDWLVTLPIMDRDYYNLFGYIYYPGYRHMFCDTELTCVAELLNCKIDCDLLFKHVHFSFHGNEDSTTLKANKTWQQGEELFSKRLKENFLIKDDYILGEITNEEYKHIFSADLAKTVEFKNLIKRLWFSK